MRLLAGLSFTAFLSCAGSSEMVSEEAAIVGGAEDDGLDMVVALISSSGHICSGTLISDRAVLTAAHCVLGEASHSVVIGENARAPKFRLDVKKAFVHPEYGHPNTHSHDLAILELIETAPVPAAPLFRETLTNSTRFIGPEMWFVGYGATDGASPSSNGRRRLVRLPIDSIGWHVSGNIDTTQIFHRAENGKATCVGDSGGPAFFIENGIASIIGVISMGGAGCESFGILARTDSVEIDAFLQATLDEIEADNACRPNGECNANCVYEQFEFDPDCMAERCGKDGICGYACIDPYDPNPYDPDCPDL